MSDDRLPTHLIVSAALRRCEQECVPAYVEHKGEAAGGMILLKVDRLDGTVQVLVQSRDLEGRAGWMSAGRGEAMDEAEAGAYTERALARDRDLWVVAVESRQGWHPFEGRRLDQ